MVPNLIVHGGAGVVESPKYTEKQYEKALKPIIKETYSILCKKDARSAVLKAICLMEDHPIFNAGYGSRLQSDGEIRMAAAIIDSKNKKFAGVINIRNVRHPIEVADILSKGRYTVLSGEKATEFARKKKIEYFSPITSDRLNEHAERLKGEFGTVGCVAIDKNGVICSGTSTGGIGYETPGRVSDSATVAGTYVSSICGVSCTGRGEHIVNLALAARIVVGVDNENNLEDTVCQIIKYAKNQKHRVGLIALDKRGKVVVGNGHKIKVFFAKYDGARIDTFLANKTTLIVN